MERAEVIVIGGGQAGLAMSYSLGRRGISNLVLERGRIAERWRSERWDSLKLLTPNWQSRLPGWQYTGPVPNGYMSATELADYLRGYAASFDAPVREGTTVSRVSRTALGYHVHTDRGVFEAGCVVIATGHCDVPHVPAMAARLPDDIVQVSPSHYRNPQQLPEGGVLVVGASATGVQLADEIHRSGRPVTMAVGRHLRLPRHYRGRDIMWWLDRCGILDEAIEDADHLRALRSQPSFQLVGREDHRHLDLAVLQASGVQLVGHATDVRGSRVVFEDDLAATTGAADDKLRRLLLRIDRFASNRTSTPPELDVPDAFDPGPSLAELDLRAAGVRSVLWATGFKRRYDWLEAAIARDVVGDDGELRHDRGVTPAAGLYALGLMGMRRRKSSFIDGVGHDAEELADHIEMRAQRPSAA